MLCIKNRIGVRSADIVLCPMVIDNIGFLALKNFTERLIQEGYFVESRTRVEIVSISGRQVIDDDHLMSELEQPIHQMRTDEACASGH